MHTRLSAVVGTICVLGMLCGGSSTLAAPVSVGHSGWSWGNPTPQGNTLNNVTFAGALGFAVGNFGTVLRSPDGGHTWVGLPSGTRNDLTLVQEIDPNTVVVGGGCSVRESVNAGASFKRLPVNESESSCATKVASFSFLSPTTGFVEQSDGSILLTTDGGQTLAPKTPVPLNGGPAGKIQFISPTTGFAITGGRILRTTDGANSWTQVAGTGGTLADIGFVNLTTAYAVGSGATMLISSDGGLTWGQLPLSLSLSGPSPSLTHISCSDPMNCLIATAPAAGAGSNVLVRTTDGGLTGSLVSASQQNLLGVSFSSAPNAVAVGQNGATVLSADGGATFPTLISRNLRNVVPGLIRVGQSAANAYAPWTAGQIAATTNGGNDWGLLRVPTSFGIRDVAFPTTQIGYALSLQGTVYRTATAGLSWSILTSGGAVPAALLAPNPPTVVLVGPRGVRRSSDSGVSFAPVNATIALTRRHGKPHKVKLASLDLSGGAQAVGGALFAYGKDLLESTDEGAGWTLIPRPVRKHVVDAISFVSPTTGYEVSARRLYFTRNRGRTWKLIPSVDVSGINAMTKISFSSARVGYVLGRLQGLAGVLMRTGDGGRTWTPEILGGPLASIAAGGLVDYAQGSGAGNLFQTTNGGLSPTPSALKLAISGPGRLSAAKLKRAGHRVRLVGRLTPALEGEIVTVSYVSGSGRWRFQTVTVAANGSFAMTVSGIKAGTVFVAQWTGNDLVSGAGTPAVALTVSRR